MRFGKTLATVLLTLSILSAPAISYGVEGTAQQLFGVEALPQMTKLRIAYMPPSVHGLVCYMAQEKGWFKDVNLDVELLPFLNGPAMMEANSSWDVGVAGAGGLISGIIGYDIVMTGLAVWDNLLDLYVREDSPIYKAGKGHIAGYPNIYGRPEDWKGTQWLLPAGTTLHLTILNTLSRIGLTDKDITISSMDATSGNTAFKAGQGDGVGLWMTLSIMAEQSGLKKASGILEGGSRISCNLFATKTALASNRDASRKFLDLFLQIANWIDNNREDCVQYFIETCEEDGISISPEVSRAGLNSTTTPTLAEQIAFSVNKMPDPRNPSQQITEMEGILIDTFDFFASQGRYSAADRAKILGGYVDPSLLLELKAEYEKAGKPIK